MDIDSIILEILDSEEYKSAEYLVSTIRFSYLEFLWGYRSNNFAPQPFIVPLLNYVDSVFSRNNISIDSMLNYMLSIFEASGKKGMIYHYYMTVTNPLQADYTNPKEIACDRSVFMHIVAGFILDYFKSPVDIKEIVDHEQFIYPKNSYGLSAVDLNQIEFKKDFFIFDGKAYMYNQFTNKRTIGNFDDMPGFAKIITEQIKDGDLLLRLDERLAFPIDQALILSKMCFVKFRGPQFHFQESKFTDLKTIIVHISPETSNKLLMVIKKDYDCKNNKEFLHIEIETLPIVEDSRSAPVITTFLHGMYYLEDDCFTHIDYTKNQYSAKDYLIKYSGSTPDKPIDLYTESKELHYKIWCIENGKYSREIWYQLMIVSLPEEYQTLLNEILA